MFKNPILPGFHPDPSICRVGSDYYLVTSSFEYFPGVPIFHSRDLVHFRAIGHCLTRPSQLSLAGAKSSEGIFAPTLRYHDGLFYLVTTNISGGGNFYVTARDPAGPWSDPVWLREESGWMDPSLFFDDDGKVYYTRHGGGERGGVYQAELDIARGELVSEPRLIWSGTGGIWPEGPHLYKVNGLYYLTIAEGGTWYGHGQTVARSSSPFGPFESCPHNPVVTHRDRPEHAIQATGHADWVQTPDGDFWMVLLGIRPSAPGHHHLGREAFLAPMKWDAAGWPVVNGNGTLELELGSEGLPPAAPWPSERARDDFDAAELGPAYHFVRNPEPEHYSLSARPGHLRVIASAASLDDLASPSFVARRQEHFSCRMSALLDFEAHAGARAGLALRANEENHYDLVVSGEGDKRRVELHARRRGVSERLAHAKLGPGPVLLEIHAERDSYEFFWAQGGRPETLGMLPTTPLSTESAGGFTGVCVGMLAVSPSGTPVAADFDWFEYSPDRA